MIASMKNAPRAAAMTFAAIILAFGFAACNTVEGAGKDIKSTGKAIEKSADDHK